MMPWAEVLAGRLLNGLPAGVVIAVAAWVVLRLAGRKNSSTRFALWFAALVAIGISPLLGGVAASGVVRAPAITVPGSWAAALLSVWAVVAGAGLMRVAMGLHGLRKLKARHEAVDVAALDPRLEQTLREFGLSRKVTLAVSDELRVPTAIGFWKPMVILPAWAVKELSAEELMAILIHELAHLKRWDDVTNLAQKVIRALLFFNPAVLWLENRLSLEREMACDDAVLAKTENPRAYAECLVAVAEKSFLRRGIALAQAAVSRIRQTSRRVAQILDGERRGAVRVWRPALALMTVFAAGCVVTVSRVPELVSFQNAVAPVVASGAIEPDSHAMVVPARYKVPEKSPRQVVVRKKVTRPKPAVKLAQRNPAGAQTVFLVVETRWTGEHARHSMTQLCIWRVTVVNGWQMPPVPGRSI
jgi:beta-lactamase regulating signal transducer with metallopeptidase domain